MAPANVTKTYDGTLAVAGLPLSPVGLLPGDAVTASSSGGWFGGSNAGVQSFELSGLQLQGADRNNYALTLNRLSGTGFIAPKVLSVDLQAADKFYDGSVQASVKGSLIGVVGADAVSLDLGTARFASKNVVRDASGAIMSQQVAVTGMGLNGQAAANYQLASDAWTSAKIYPRVLSVTGTSVQNKVEDGSDLAQLVPGTLLGLVGQEQLVLLANGRFDSSLAGNGKRVDVQFALQDGPDGALASNYEITGLQLQGNILPRSKANPVQPLVLPASVSGVVGRQRVSLINGQGATAAANLKAEPESRQTCSVNNPQACSCHSVSDTVLEVCASPQ